MTSEFQIALQLLAELDTTFPGTQSLIVGGAVRDYLLGVPATDVDIATNIPFDQLQESFQLADITKNTEHAQPVSMIRFRGCDFEIATFRSDSSGTVGRSNNVPTIVNSFAHDAARRDITINAIGMNSRQEIIDPEFGERDLRDRVIRAVGIPAFRFREDATRILRVFRFAARFGFQIESDTDAAATQNKWRLQDRSQISPESIAKELYKAASNGVTLCRFITGLNNAGILCDILPEFTALHGFTHDPQYHPEGGSTVIGHILECLNCSESADPVVNLGILFHDLGKAVTRGDKENGHSNYHGHEEAGVPIVQGIFDRLKFNDLSAEDKAAILFSVERHMLIHNLNELSIKTLVKLIHNPGWAVLKAVGYADEASRGNELFGEDAFHEKISKAEAKVVAVAESKDDLRLKVKEYIDGHKIMAWFPETEKNQKMLRPILEQTADFILEKLDQGYSPTQDDIIRQIQAIITFHLYE